MTARLSSKLLLAAVTSLLVTVNAHAGHNRGERESEIRKKFDWVVFDGEFSAANVTAYALESYFAGGQITSSTLEECAKKMGKDVAGEMIRNGFDPKRDRMYSGLMVFNNWQDTPFGKVPLPNKWVPYVAVRRSGGGGSNPNSMPNANPTNPDFFPDSSPPNAHFLHILFRIQGTDGTSGYITKRNYKQDPDMWFMYMTRIDGLPPYSGWFRGIIRNDGGPSGVHFVLTPVNGDHNRIKIYQQQDLILYDMGGNQVYKKHPIYSGRWERNPMRYRELLK
jgi:hypothetical protein